MKNENIKNNIENQETQRLLKEAAAHSKRMRTSANPNERKCIDGGYRENESPGATAIPGGDLGISMALLKLGYSAQESFDIVHNFTLNNEQSYSWHTDTHEGHQDCIVGCGHCNAAINNSQSFGVSQEAVQQLLDIVRHEQQTESNIKMTTLNREHQEKGILIITSPQYTIKPWDEEQNNQYFIYDQQRHIELLKELIKFSKQQNVDINYDKLLAASDEQANATLGLLKSSQGKPIYTVDASTSEPTIKFLKYAPLNI